MLSQQKRRLSNDGYLHDIMRLYIRYKWLIYLEDLILGAFRFSMYKHHQMSLFNDVDIADSLTIALMLKVLTKEQQFTSTKSKENWSKLFWDQQLILSNKLHFW